MLRNLCVATLVFLGGIFGLLFDMSGFHASFGTTHILWFLIAALVALCAVSSKPALAVGVLAGALAADAASGSFAAGFTITLVLALVLQKYLAQRLEQKTFWGTLAGAALVALSATLILISIRLLMHFPPPPYLLFSAVQFTAAHVALVLVAVTLIALGRSVLAVKRFL